MNEYCALAEHFAGDLRRRGRSWFWKGDKWIMSQLEGVLGSYSWAGLGPTKRPGPPLFGTETRAYIRWFNSIRCHFV